MSTVAVVGGGWAGMAAAVELAARGHRVTLLEAAPHLGGRARRVNWDGLAVDNGQHMLLGAYKASLQLIERVDPGFAAQAFWRLPMRFSVPGEFSLRLPRLPAPLHLLAGLLRAQGLRPSDKIALLRGMARLERQLAGDSAPFTAAAVLQPQPPRLLAAWWQPLCAAALNTPLQEASAQVFARVLRAALRGRRGDSDFLLPRVDLGRILAEPAAGFLRARGARIITGRRVASVLPEARSVRLIGRDFDASFDAAILAAAPRQAALALPAGEPWETLRRGLLNLTAYPIRTAYLRYPQGTCLPEPLIGLMDEAAHFAFDRGASHGQAGLIAVVQSAVSGPLGESSAWARRCHLVLRRRLANLPEPLACKVITEKQAAFACVPELRRPPADTPHPRLMLAGDYVAGPFPGTLEGAVMAGLQSATRLSLRLSSESASRCITQFPLYRKTAWPDA